LEKSACSVLAEKNIKERNYYEDLAENGRITLNWILEVVTGL
jgi:hypothetical protein